MTQEDSQPAGNRPAYILYIVPERSGGRWIPVGAAFAHGDGRGFNILRDITITTDMKLALREPKTDGDDGRTVITGLLS